MGQSPADPPRVKVEWSPKKAAGCACCLPLPAPALPEPPCPLAACTFSSPWGAGCRHPTGSTAEAGRAAGLIPRRQGCAGVFVLTSPAYYNFNGI